MQAGPFGLWAWSPEYRPLPRTDWLSFAAFPGSQKDRAQEEVGMSVEGPINESEGRHRTGWGLPKHSGSCPDCGSGSLTAFLPRFFTKVSTE